MSHQTISFIKSAFRIVACILLLPLAWLPAVLLGLAEGIGILEEIGHE